MTYYNIWAWKDAENPQRPDCREMKFHRETALSAGKHLADRYPLVEVEQVEAPAHDLDSIEATSLVRSWKNGIQQTK
jgi:hypothetical protein